MAYNHETGESAECYGKVIITHKVPYEAKTIDAWHKGYTPLMDKMDIMGLYGKDTLKHIVPISKEEYEREVEE